MKKIASIVLALALVLSLGTAAMADGVQLSDVHAGQWFYEPVSKMIAAGYIDGYEDGTFRPDRDVSVAEFVTMTARCLGLETGSEYGHWAGVQMRNAYDKGWLTEQDCPWTEFNSPVSRQLAARILAVALGLELTDTIPYTDRADVGQSYVLYVGAMCSAGLLDGFEDNTIRPGSILTRAQAATLIYRASDAAKIERVTSAPDGTPFAKSIDLGSYDNPNFSVTLSGGVASVDITHVELWTDVADPNSSDPGRRRRESAARRNNGGDEQDAHHTHREPRKGRIRAALYELVPRQRRLGNRRHGGRPLVHGRPERSVQQRRARAHGNSRPARQRRDRPELAHHELYGWLHQLLRR